MGCEIPYFDVKFKPQKDSINDYYMDGGLGCGTSREYHGLRIKN